MPIPSLEDLLSADISEFALVAAGDYNAVITGCEVRPGPKGPYLNVEATIHSEEFKGSKVWGMSSFSEKAFTMPGGVANLVQSAQPDIDRDTPAEALPAEVAQKVVTLPVLITVGHEQVKRNGVLQTNTDGSPEMRARVTLYAPPDPDFLQTIEAEAAGLDDDLPF